MYVRSTMYMYMFVYICIQVSSERSHGYPVMQGLASKHE